MNNLFWRVCLSRCLSKNSSSPEVVHELLELVRASGQRHNDVDEYVGRVHPLAFHLQEWTEGPEEDQASEVVARLAPEGQLVQRTFVPLCASDA